MKFIYLVDYWVPFPSSEYGGLICLIASTDTEAFGILSNEKAFDESYAHLIMPNIVKAQKFELASPDYEVGILDSFTT